MNSFDSRTYMCQQFDHSGVEVFAMGAQLKLGVEVEVSIMVGSSSSFGFGIGASVEFQYGPKLGVGLSESRKVSSEAAAKQVEDDGEDEDRRLASSHVQQDRRKLSSDGYYYYYYGYYGDCGDDNTCETYDCDGECADCYTHWQGKLQHSNVIICENFACIYPL